MKFPCLVGDGARASLIEKLRQIESLQPGMTMPPPASSEHARSKP